MQLIACLLLFAAAWSAVVLARRWVSRRRALRRGREQALGVALVGAAFASLFVGVLVTSPPGWLPYAAWTVAGTGAGLLTSPSRSVVPGT